MREDLEIEFRVVKSYKMMLDFYGLELLDPITGQIGKQKNWKERFDNITQHTHNNLRISTFITQ
jgi:hypothetical protein